MTLTNSTMIALQELIWCSVVCAILTIIVRLEFPVAGKSGPDANRDEF